MHLENFYIWILKTDISIFIYLNILKNMIPSDFDNWMGSVTRTVPDEWRRVVRDIVTCGGTVTLHSFDSIIIYSGISWERNARVLARPFLRRHYGPQAAAIARVIVPEYTWNTNKPAPNLVYSVSHNNEPPKWTDSALSCPQFIFQNVFV